MTELFNDRTTTLIYLAVLAFALLVTIAVYRLYVALTRKGSLTKEAKRRLNGQCAVFALAIVIPLNACLVSYTHSRALLPFVALIHKILSKTADGPDLSSFANLTWHLQLVSVGLYMVELGLLPLILFALAPLSPDEGADAVRPRKSILAWLGRPFAARSGGI